MTATDIRDALRATTTPALLVRCGREETGTIAVRSGHRGHYRERM